MSIEAGVNMEFIRSRGQVLRGGRGARGAARLSYVEPMVHNGRELLSEAGYFHSVSLDDEPLRDEGRPGAHGSEGVRPERALPADAAGDQRALPAEGDPLCGGDRARRW